MNKKRQDWIRYNDIGPGGMHCECCGPKPGEERRRVLRAAKRRMRREVNDEIRDEMEDDHNIDQ